MTVLTTTPQEIIATPLTLWLAPIGTAFPDVSIAAGSISASWKQVGVNGDLDYDSSGLTVTHSQTLATWQPVGSTAATKVWRTGEVVEVAVTLADTTPNAYAQALNGVTPTSIAVSTGVAAQYQVPLLQGTNVNAFALLARGISAINNSLPAQYCIPCVYQSGSPAPVYKLGAPAELALTYSGLLDPNGGGFGYLAQQSA